MTALAADRNTAQRYARDFLDPMAASVKIYAGSLVVLDASGNAKPGVTGTGLVARGRAAETVDNTSGSAGAKSVPVEAGVFAFASDGTLTRAHIGKTVYIVDDQTVAATDGTSTRSAAGTLKDLEGSGSTAVAWVQIG
ncbi:MAG TPA: hypothetical protein VN436_10980 [Holophaga sp.]|nr:hypothetical protein [Holophaga sp.]